MSKVEKPIQVAVLDMFDGLPAVDVEAIQGLWRGSELPTGHPLDGVLTRIGWYGKRFDGPDDVHPLLFSRPDGSLWDLNPAFVPLRLLLRRPGLGRVPGAGRALRLLRLLLATRRPTARLRMAEYRGVVSATLCYDALPIHDVFRRIDDVTLLGVMDVRGVRPYPFRLHKQPDQPQAQPTTRQNGRPAGSR